MTARQFKGSVTLAATAAMALGGALVFGPQAQAAQAAPQKTMQLDCGNKEKTFHAHASLVGSGAPTAQYDVRISVIDLKSYKYKPIQVRLMSANQDGTRTEYPWRYGDQGQNVQTYWDTTLQQPKGLKYVFLDARDGDGGCSDYGPK